MLTTAPRKSSSLAGSNGAVGPEDEALDVVVVVVVVAVALVRVRGVVAMLAVLVVVVMVVVVVVVVFLQEVGVDVELGVQVEAAQVEHVLQRHLAEMHRLLRRARVHVLEAVHQRLGLVLGRTRSVLLMKIWSAKPTWRRASWRSLSCWAACLASTSVRMESSR